MKRIRYSVAMRDDGGTPVLWVSSGNFTLENGTKVLVSLSKNDYSITNAETRAVLMTGSTSGGSVYIRRVAKAALTQLMAPGTFEAETRKKK